jgi:hypothetical protein
MATSATPLPPPPPPLHRHPTATPPPSPPPAPTPPVPCHLHLRHSTASPPPLHRPLHLQPQLRHSAATSPPPRHCPFTTTATGGDGAYASVPLPRHPQRALALISLLLCCSLQLVPSFSFACCLGAAYVSSSHPAVVFSSRAAYCLGAAHVSQFVPHPCAFIQPCLLPGCSFAAFQPSRMISLVFYSATSAPLTSVCPSCTTHPGTAGLPRGRWRLRPVAQSACRA